MNEAIFAQVQKEMDESVSALRKELAKLRTGRASTALLDHVVVEYYGATTPLNQLATLSAPETRLLVIQPYDRSSMVNIEKALLKSDLGLTPNNDGKIIRVPIPQLTEERRKDLVKHLHNVVEQHRVAARNVRRDANEVLKKLLKDKKISEDEQRRSQDETQKLTDEAIGELDKIGKAKEHEIMEIR